MASVVALAQAKAGVLASRRWLERMLYPAVFLLFFVLFLFVTFPFDDLARSLEARVREAGGDLTIERMRASGLGGVAAFGIKLRLPVAPGADPLPELSFDRLDLRPDYLRLLLRRQAFSYSLEGYGGKASGNAALSRDPRQPGLDSLTVNATNLDLKRLPIKDLAGLEVSGRANLKADFSKLSTLDLASGVVSTTIKGAGAAGSIKGFTLPRTNLGDIEFQSTLDKGGANIDRAFTRGGDVEADADGTVRLKPLFSLSQADAHLRFKLSEAWLNQNPVFRSLLSAVNNARQNDGSFVFTVVGPLSNINFRPGR